MLTTLVFLASVAFSSWSDWPVSVGGTPTRAIAEQLQLRYPNNINCKDFAMTALKGWHLRTRSSMDLGNWDGAFWISGTISRGVFVRRGSDLFDILETKCGMIT